MKGRKKRRALRELLNEYDSLLLLSEALGVTVSDEGEIYKDIVARARISCHTDTRSINTF